MRKERGVAGSLHVIEGADHSYKLPAALRGKRTQELERSKLPGYKPPSLGADCNSTGLIAIRPCAVLRALL